MPVPSVITDLNSTAASNSPADTEQRTTADDYIRALSAFVRQNYDVLVGGQFTFPAVQNASAGANVLDDYEEGTWTPTVAASTGTITSYTSSGRYTKIGNVVHISAALTITTKGTAASGMTMSLPFTSNGSAAFSGIEIQNSGKGVVGAVANASSTASFNLSGGGTTPFVADGDLFVITGTFWTA